MTTFISSADECHIQWQVVLIAPERQLLNPISVHWLIVAADESNHSFVISKRGYSCVERCSRVSGEWTTVGWKHSPEELLCLAWWCWRGCRQFGRTEASDRKSSICRERTQFQLAELVKQFLGDNGNPLLFVSQLPRKALGYLWRKGPKMQHAKAVMWVSVFLQVTKVAETGNEEWKATKTYTGKTKDKPENMTRDAERWTKHRQTQTNQKRAQTDTHYKYTHKVIRHWSTADPNSRDDRKTQAKHRNSRHRPSK